MSFIVDTPHLAIIDIIMIIFFYLRLNKTSIKEIQPDERDKTKHLVYALMYGAGPYKLMEILHLTYTKTTEVISKFLG